MQNISASWDGAAQISLFTKLSVTNDQASVLRKRLLELPEIESVQLVSREKALEEFRQLSGFGEALDMLEENPLPAVLIIRPGLAHSSPETLNRLLEQLHREPETDLAQLDMQWVKRLYTIMEIGQRGVIVIAALLGLAVLLVVGNTIRLDIQNRRDEIIITKLIGATNAFIRRPFLYCGLWYGLLGGLVAWTLIETALAILAGPVQRLAGLYGSNFSLISLSAGNTLFLFGLSISLALAGSWLAVGRHLNSIEPT
jgi:cell division transport system permease protein